MLWILILGWMSFAGADVQVQSEHADVQIKSEFFGARFNTSIAVQRTHLHRNRTSKKVLEHNTRQLADLKRWAAVSQRHFTFDDYGLFRLVVHTVDALPIEHITAQYRGTQTVSEALHSGVWTENDRLLAVAGGLKSLGFSVALLQTADGRLIMGLGTSDSDVNAASITVRWMEGVGRTSEPKRVEWLLWDGLHRIGHLTKLGSRPNLDGLSFLTNQRHTGKPFSFMTRVAPSFTMRKQSSVALPLTGRKQMLRMKSYPDMARWFALFPEYEFERQVQFAQQEREWLQMGRSVRQLARELGSEQEVINVLLRTIQTQFEYKIGPLRSMVEVVHSREADCDQMAMFMLVALLELGYSSKDVVAVNWPEHLALGIRSKGRSPEGSSVRHNGTKYHVLDLTYYVYEEKRLTSTWGNVSPKYGTQVTVGELKALKRSGHRAL